MGLIQVCTRTACIPNPTLFEEDLQRTEFRERGLNEIESNKRCEPVPVWTVEVGQCQAAQNKHSSNTTDEHVHFHGDVLIQFIFYQ